MDARKTTTRQRFTSQLARVAIKRKQFTADNGDQKTVTTLTGYPILWNQTSSDRGGYVVKLAANSANFTTPCLALFNHDFKSVIGNTANNTLRIGQADETGIPIEIDLPDTTTGNDLAELVSKGYVAGMSFSMANGFEKYSEAKDGNQNVLTCSQFTVDEITVTAVPAFTATTIGVKDDGQDNEDESDDADDEDEPDLSNRVAASLRLHRLRLAMLTGRDSAKAA